MSPGRNAIQSWQQEGKRIAPYSTSGYPPDFIWTTHSMRATFESTYRYIFFPCDVWRLPHSGEEGCPTLGRYFGEQTP